jgi:hypothetical protein
MGDIMEVVTETKKTRRGVQIVEREVPFHSSTKSQATCSTGFKSAQNASDSSNANVTHTAAQQSNEADNLHTLLPIEEQEDYAIHLDIEDSSPQSNVCF